MVVVRQEQPKDIAAVRVIHQRAFEGPQEADLVDSLRENCPGLLSLVATMEGRVVGHILFSPAVVEGEDRAVEGMGLAPMAVLPEHQRRGIGSMLVETGIARLKDQGCPFVIVLGHAGYYPRFGFVPASRHGIRCEWDAPDDAFMILINDMTVMSGLAGVARYRSEFNAAM